MSTALKDAKLYRRRNGTLGSSCDGCADTGHHIVEVEGGLAVYSIHEEETLIANHASPNEAERAIATDWRARP
ncbi:hypothetical protein HF272_13565 [Rhizobium leguminosarum]|uniref:hypothetical protein n=1 Tax=Rhizobium leguminosarum TaxID=384 RepID=UPI001C91A407|nr:hypothetical protein [Rhizobium leguminosarum]MBY2992457.1 hypothetical protein [Rhizobium leguminosarum]